MNRLSFADRQYKRIAEGYRAAACSWYLANKAALLRDMVSIRVDRFRTYEALLQRRPFPNTERVLKSTVCVTTRSVDRVLQSTYSLADKIAILSYCIELGGHIFFDGRSPQKLKHLAGAKASGYFFTPPSVAMAMVESALRMAPGNIDGVLDPACGSGIFLGFALISKPKLGVLRGLELDHFTACLAKRILRYAVRSLKSTARILIENRDFLQDERDDTAELIIMNPPYGRLRFTAPSLTNKETLHGLSGKDARALTKTLRHDALKIAASLRELTAGKYAEKGIPDLSRLFVRKALSKLAPGGLLAAITSSAWLADKSAEPLRRFVFEKHRLRELWTFIEAARLFSTVNQSTAVAFFEKKGSEAAISYRPMLRDTNDLSKRTEYLPKAFLDHGGSQSRLPQRGDRFELVGPIRKCPRLSEHEQVINRRGEFDLTVHKQGIRTFPTDTRLVRGDHISEFVLLEPAESEKGGYVDPCYVSSVFKRSTRSSHASNPRIAIPQCSYLLKKKRVEAAIVPSGPILANSCNYLSLTTYDPALLRYYTALLNSLVVEWYFCLFNSNNHVANYELDDLPIPQSPTGAAARELEELYLECEKEPWGDSRLHLEVAIMRLYGLKREQTTLLLEDLKRKLDVRSNALMSHAPELVAS